jgi:hypothetical protein
VWPPLGDLESKDLAADDTCPRDKLYRPLKMRDIGAIGAILNRTGFPTLPASCNEDP